MIILWSFWLSISAAKSEKKLERIKFKWSFNEVFNFQVPQQKEESEIWKVESWSDHFIKFMTSKFCNRGKKVESRKKNVQVIILWSVWLSSSIVERGKKQIPSDCFYEVLEFRGSHWKVKCRKSKCLFYEVSNILCP